MLKIKSSWFYYLFLLIVVYGVPIPLLAQETPSAAPLPPPATMPTPTPVPVPPPVQTPPPVLMPTSKEVINPCDKEPDLSGCQPPLTTEDSHPPDSDCNKDATQPKCNSN